MIKTILKSVLTAAIIVIVGLVAVFHHHASKAAERVEKSSRFTPETPPLNMETVHKSSGNHTFVKKLNAAGIDIAVQNEIHSENLPAMRERIYLRCVGRGWKLLTFKGKLPNLDPATKKSYDCLRFQTGKDELAVFVFQRMDDGRTLVSSSMVNTKRIIKDVQSGQISMDSTLIPGHFADIAVGSATASGGGPETRESFLLTKTGMSCSAAIERIRGKLHSNGWKMENFTEALDKSGAFKDGSLMVAYKNGQLLHVIVGKENNGSVAAYRISSAYKIKRR